MDFPATPFWDFSVALYSRPGVGPACLALQERHHVDVNILMFCLWLADAGHPAASEADMRDYCAAVAPWHANAVRGLRAVRQWMKPERPPVDHALAQDLRARIQKIEIDAEHLEQITLSNCVRTQISPTSASEQLAAAASNIRKYFRVLGIEPAQEDDVSLATILREAFSTTDETAIAGALRGNHV